MLVRILIIVVLIIILLFIIGLFSKKEYSFERETSIKRSKPEVFDYIKLLKNQDNFSKWASMDPAMKKEYIGIDGVRGFKWAWDSEKKDVGKGVQEIVKITEGERVDWRLHFIKPFDGYADTYMTVDAVTPSETKVRWGFHSSMKYPMNIMLLFMDMDNMIGDDLAIGLNNLKEILEKK